MNLVDFIVIGSMKSGTSALYHWLFAHPELDMCSVKEPGFFALEANDQEAQVSKYRALFRNNGLLKGEASTSYTKHPLKGSNASKSIARWAGSAKLIYLMRDPLERYVSHVHFNQIKGHENRSLGEIVQSEPGSHYLACSQYGMQLERYRQFIERGLLHAVWLEDIKQSQDGLRELCRFLGIKESIEPFAARNTTHSEAASFISLRQQIRRSPGWRRLDRNLKKVPGLSQAYQSLFYQAIDRPVLSPDEKERLTELLAGDNELLGELIS